MSMRLNLDKNLAEEYNSPSQKIRVLTEGWVDNEVFCPSCGCDIGHYENNKPVADFFCLNCKEDYELKSKKDSIGSKIVDGAYRTMLERLRSNSIPNFFLLNYNLRDLEVLNFFVIPKHFFVPQIIEKRKPLSQSARRAGWIGCNISLQNIPQTGKIFYIKDKQIESKDKVLRNWGKTLFLREEKESPAKGWILDIMNCIDKLGKRKFSLEEVYSFKESLEEKHPQNRHIKDKIRQQLQFLRDKGYLEFVGQGRYRLI